MTMKQIQRFGAVNKNTDSDGLFVAMRFAVETIRYIDLVFHCLFSH